MKIYNGSVIMRDSKGQLAMARYQKTISTSYSKELWVSADKKTFKHIQTDYNFDRLTNNRTLQLTAIYFFLSLVALAGLTSAIEYIYRAYQIVTILAQF